MLELPPHVVQALLDAGVARDDVVAAWTSLSARARHGLGLARRLLEMGAAQPDQLERALGGTARPVPARRRFAGYEVVRPLGRGAMGEVNLVVDGQGREFALKTLAEVDDPVLIERFQREIHAMCALDHPHLARIHDAGVVGKTPYLVMDHYPGGSLDRHLAGGPLDPGLAREITGKLASALAAVHAQGLVHRDVKPENVLFDPAGEPRLADFGLATAGERSLQTGRLTLSAEVLGTPAYMAPEQALDAKEVGPAADVYALGGLLYAMLTGRPPFATSGGMIAVLQAVISTPVTPPHKLVPSIPLGLSELCVRALAKAPKDRPESAVAFAHELAADRPQASIPRGVLALLLLSMLALCAAVATVWLRSDAPAPASLVPPPTLAPRVLTSLDLARAGLPSAAWAAWSLEEQRDAAWVRRGEALLVAGFTPSAPELDALQLDAATHSRWLVYLSARDTLSPRPLPQPIGRASRQLELSVAAQQLKFSPSELRASFVGFDPSHRNKNGIVRRMEADVATLVRTLGHAPSEYQYDSPAEVALLDLTVIPLAEIAIYWQRHLEREHRVRFEVPVPVEDILALRELLPPGSGSDALEVAAVAIPFLQTWNVEREFSQRTQHARTLIQALEPFCFERLNRLSVQMRVWCMGWFLECRDYEVALPTADLVREVRSLLAVMDEVSWQSPALDGRRHLDEDEIYRRGTALLLLETYPRTMAPEAWPGFAELEHPTERALGAKPSVLDTIAKGHLLLARGDLRDLDYLLRGLKPDSNRDNKQLLWAAYYLQLARLSETPAQRDAKLQNAEEALEALKRKDWNKPHWAAWIDLLCQREAEPAELQAAEDAWQEADSMQKAPPPYQLFDPERLHFVPRPGAELVLFPPRR